MSDYRETNRKIEVNGEQELENGVVKYNYKSENSNVAPTQVLFTGVSEDVKFRGYFDVQRNSFAFTEEGGEVSASTRTSVRDTINSILANFTNTAE